MSSSNDARPRAVADLTEGLILASVEVAVAPERVFRALASNEITTWWVRPGVFDTREWVGDVQPGGRWRASGMTRGQPYVQEGEFLEVEPPRWLVHTWDDTGRPGKPSTVTYLVEPTERGTRVTLQHLGFVSREMCSAFAIGWETSFERLAEILAPDLSLTLSSARGLHRGDDV
jgi:uncharacterized protein YndB with AHSA1/START domain